MTATVRAIYIIWYRDLLRFGRERVRLVVSLAQPLLFLLVFGTGLSSAFVGGVGGGGTSYRQFIFPGIIGMAVLFTAIFGAMSIVWDREFGFLKEVLVAPIDRSAVAIGKALGGATQALIQGLLLLVLAPFVGVRLSLATIAALIPVVFALAFSLSAFGVAIASRMRSMQGFQVVMNLVMMPMFFLSGALFPMSGLPPWMALLSRLDPATYGMDAIRRIVLAGHSGPTGAGLTLLGRTLSIREEVVILLAFGFAMLALAIRHFRARD